MTTNSSSTQIEWDQFRKKCSELEQECSNSEVKCRSLLMDYSDLEGVSVKSDHIDDDLMGYASLDEAFADTEGCLILLREFSALGEKCKELSHACITLGHKKSNLNLSKYTAKAEYLKACLIRLETLLPVIKLKLL